VKQIVLLQLTLQDVTWWLAFENAKEAAVFWDHFVLGSSIFSTEILMCTDLLHLFILRSSMSQDRVKSLAVLQMNSDITKQLDYEYVIDDFATKKARRKPLVALLVSLICIIFVITVLFVCRFSWRYIHNENTLSLRKNVLRGILNLWCDE